MEGPLSIHLVKENVKRDEVAAPNPLVEVWGAINT